GGPHRPRLRGCDGQRGQVPLTTSPPLEVAVSVEAGDWPEDLDALAEKAIRHALARSGAKVVGPAEVSVVLTNDAHQRVLNRDWRKIDKATNVLSFPQLDAF